MVNIGGPRGADRLMLVFVCLLTTAGKIGGGALARSAAASRSCSLIWTCPSRASDN
jgi:hypothetical protein